MHSSSDETSPDLASALPLRAAGYATGRPRSTSRTRLSWGDAPSVTLSGSPRLPDLPFSEGHGHRPVPGVQVWSGEEWKSSVDARLTRVEQTLSSLRCGLDSSNRELQSLAVRFKKFQGVANGNDAALAVTFRGDELAEQQWRSTCEAQLERVQSAMRLQEDSDRKWHMESEASIAQVYDEMRREVARVDEQLRAELVHTFAEAKASHCTLAGDLATIVDALDEVRNEAAAQELAFHDERVAGVREAVTEIKLQHGQQWSRLEQLSEQRGLDACQSFERAEFCLAKQFGEMQLQQGEQNARAERLCERRAWDACRICEQSESNLAQRLADQATSLDAWAERVRCLEGGLKSTQTEQAELRKGLKREADLACLLERDAELAWCTVRCEQARQQDTAAELVGTLHDELCSEIRDVREVVAGQGELLRLELLHRSGPRCCDLNSTEAIGLTPEVEKATRRECAEVLPQTQSVTAKRTGLSPQCTQHMAAMLLERRACAQARRNVLRNAQRAGA